MILDFRNMEDEGILIFVVNLNMNGYFPLLLPLQRRVKAQPLLKNSKFKLNASKAEV